MNRSTPGRKTPGWPGRLTWSPMRPVFPAILALAGALTAAQPRAEAGDASLAAANGWQPVSLVYEVHAGGLHVFTIDLEAQLGARDYGMSMALRTDGVLAWLLDLTMLSRVEGRPAAGGPLPARFRTESRWRGRERWVELRYRDGEGPGVTAEPPPEDDNRPTVPEVLRRDTIDPLSAGVALIYGLAGSGNCEAALPVFDGRRLFQARSRDLGPVDVPVSDLSPYGGAARACAVTVEPVTGFWRDQPEEPKTQDLTIYLRAIEEGGPPLPLRIDTDSRFGAVRVHLVGVTGGAEES